MKTVSSYMISMNFQVELQKDFLGNNQTFLAWTARRHKYFSATILRCVVRRSIVGATHGHQLLFRSGKIPCKLGGKRQLITQLYLPMFVETTHMPRRARPYGSFVFGEPLKAQKYGCLLECEHFNRDYSRATTFWLRPCISIR